MKIFGIDVGKDSSSTIPILFYTTLSVIISIIIWSLSKYWSGWPISGNNYFKETDNIQDKIKKILWLQSRIFWILLIIIFILLMYIDKGNPYDGGPWDPITKIITDPPDLGSGVVAWGFVWLFIQLILLILSFTR